ILLGTVLEADMLDDRNIQAFSNGVMTCLRQCPQPNVLLNFESVKFMSSAVISELLRINEYCRQRAGELRLCGVRKQIFEVFQITQLDRLFSVVPEESADTALQRFERSIALRREAEAWNASENRNTDG
ncbi:MAG TPA: STAS domain-containing protein, partial [Candidatus Hydrogenedentes bacterium]|nr:STAS domain-containing protein [Candidatus Hydrogenedentota bacterium]